MENSNLNSQDTAFNADSHNDSSSDALTEILRAGAQKMLAAAIDQEVAGYINDRNGVVDENGRRLFLRNGLLPQREILTGIRPVAVNQPRVRDRQPPPGREVFPPSILPKYLRKTKSIEELVPGLYLKGIRTNDFLKPCSRFSELT